MQIYTQRVSLRTRFWNGFGRKTLTSRCLLLAADFFQQRCDEVSRRPPAGQIKKDGDVNDFHRFSLILIDFHLFS